MVAIEDHFKICFEPEDEEEIETINQVVDLILRKLAESESNSESLPKTVAHALHRAADLGSVNDGIRFLDRHEKELSNWASLLERAQMAAGFLHSKGVKQKDTVALVLPTCPEFIDAWLGCQLLGAVPVALYPPVRLGRLDEYFEQTAIMIRSAAPVCIVSDARVRRVLGRLLPNVQLPLGLIKAEHLSQGVAPKDLNMPQDDDLAMVQFSSGTTVSPKPVALTHQQILANAAAIMDFFPHDDGIEHAGVSWLPLYHDMGLIGCIIPALLRPGPLTNSPPEVFLPNRHLAQGDFSLSCHTVTSTRLCLWSMYRSHS